MPPERAREHRPSAGSGNPQPVTGGSKTPTTPIRALLHAFTLVILTSRIPALPGVTLIRATPCLLSSRPCRARRR